MRKCILYAAVVAVTSACASESFAMISFVTREGVSHKGECSFVRHEEKETHSGIALFSYTPEGTNTTVSYYAEYQFYNTAAGSLMYALVFPSKEANTTSVSYYARYQPYVQDTDNPQLCVYSKQPKDVLDTASNGYIRCSGCDMSVNSIKTPMYENIVSRDIVEHTASPIYRDAFEDATSENAAPLPKISRDVLLRKMQQDNSSRKKDSSPALIPALHSNSAPIPVLHSNSTTVLPKRVLSANCHSRNFSEGAISTGCNRSSNASNLACYYDTSIDPEYAPAPLPIVRNMYTIMPPVNPDSRLSTKSTTSANEINAIREMPQENSDSNFAQNIQNTDEKNESSRAPLKRSDRKSVNKAKNDSRGSKGHKSKHSRKNLAHSSRGQNSKYSAFDYSYYGSSSSSSFGSLPNSCSSSSPSSCSESCSSSYSESCPSSCSESCSSSCSESCSSSCSESRSSSCSESCPSSCSESCSSSCSESRSSSCSESCSSSCSESCSSSCSESCSSSCSESCSSSCFGSSPSSCSDGSQSSCSESCSSSSSGSHGSCSDNSDRGEK